MQMFRSERLDMVNGRLVRTSTELLDLYLDPQDIEALVDPERRYTMDRFMGCTERGGIPGWAIEDKVHIRLDTPFGGYTKKLAELSLDPGGDLYFTIWNGEPLRRASEHEEFNDMDSFVTSDPSEKLKHVGIKTIRLHQLSELAAKLSQI